MAVEAIEDRWELLKQLVPLNTLPEKNLRQLLEQAEIKTVKRGDFLFQEGDTEPKNIYLLEGKVNLLSGGKVMDTVEAGTEAARFALAHRLPRELSARARGKAEFIQIDSHVLGELVERCRQDAFKVGDIDAEADDWMSQLLRSRVFQHIPPANIQRVMMRMEEVEVKKGEQVVRQGDEGDYFYLINKGRCSVARASSESPEPVELAHLGPGDSFGEEALLSDSPRGSTVTMMSKGVLLRLSKEDFVELVKNPLAKYISYEDAQKLVEQDGVWVDVRSQEEHEGGFIPGSMNLPLSSLRFQSTSLAADRRYIVYCKDGAQSTVAAFLLTEREFDVAVLKGGIASVPGDALIKETPPIQEAEEKAVEPKAEKAASGAALHELKEVTEKWTKAQAQVDALEKQLRETKKAAKRQTVDTDQALELWESQLKELEQEREEQEQARIALEVELNEAKEQLAEQASSKEQVEASRLEMEALRAELEARLSELEQAKAVQISQIGELESVRTALETELDQAKGELAGKASAEEQVAAVRAELEARLSELEKAGEEQAAQISELESVRTALEAELEQTKGELAGQTSAEEQVAAVRAELEARLSELEKAGEEQAAQISELESVCTALEVELEQAKGELAGQTSAEEQVAAVRAELEARLSELEKAGEEQAAQISELESVRTTLETELDQAKGELAGQTSAEEQVAAVRAELEARLSELEKAGEEQAAQISELESVRTALETELDQAKGELAGQASAEEQVAAVRAELEARLSELEKAGEEQAAQISELESVRTTLEKERDELKEAHQLLEARLAELQQGGTEAEPEELQGLREQLQEARIQIESLEAGGESKVIELHAQLDLVRAEADSRVASLQKELDEAQVRLREAGSTADGDAASQEALRQELGDLRRALEQRQHEAEQAQHEQRDLEDALEDRSEQLERAHQEQEKIAADLESLEARYQELEAARLQAETALTSLQQKTGMVVESQPIQDVAAGFPLKAAVSGALLGAVLSFALLEAVMIMGGRGEIISGLVGGEVPPSSRVVEVEAVAKVAPPPAAVVKSPAQPVAKPVELPSVEASKPTATQKQKPGGFSSSIGRELRDRLPGGVAGPEMVRIAAGKFVMGSDRSLLAKDERPAHQVKLGSYYIGRFEVTFDEYDRFAKATGRALPDDQGWGRGKRPVINVTWEDASAYAKWLSKQTGATYRLPTEAEWEYAAGGGNASLFWWGYEIGENRANCFNCGGDWGGKKTAPVGIFEPNPYGIHNTAGNVMEWVQDCYHPNYQGAPAEGGAWVSPKCEQRVVRGGAFSKPGESMRTTKRNQQDAKTHLPILGFRLVREK